MSGEQSNSRDCRLGDDFVVRLEASGGLCFFNAVCAQLGRSLRNYWRSSPVDYKTGL